MIKFGPWLPDIATFNSVASTVADGVIPEQSGFTPFPSFGAVASAITARAQGAISIRNLSGTVFNFCGDATKLYKMASTGLTWDDVSRVAGGAYATGSDGFWQFTQFGNSLIATNGVDVPQLFTLGTSTNFAALTGTPPTASFVATVRGFVVFARVSTAWNRVHWSALEDPTDYVASATTLSDAQDLPDGGVIMGLTSGEYGIVLQERSVSRMSFEGPPTAFRFDRISNTLGCRLEGSVQAYDNLCFFAANDGFYMLRGGVELVPIGENKCDHWFEDNFDANYPFRVSSAIDPVNKLYIVGFPSTSAVAGLPDTLIIYHWSSGQWATAAVTHEIVYPGATQTGYTLDGLDSVSGSVDALAYSLDSRMWTGSGRLLLAGFNSSHQAGFFTGTNLAATLETGDAQLTPGRKSLLRAVRPMVEGSSVTPSLTVRYRNRTQDPLLSASAVAANSNGMCRVRVGARYHRAKITIPAASSWNFATGIDDLEFSAMGER